MLSLRGLTNAFIKVPAILPLQVIQCAGLKNFVAPIQYGEIEFPERARLRIMEKVPQYPGNLRPPKMTKRLMLMRGPEKVHDFLVHEQYGIMATSGGRMKIQHFENVRMSIIKKLDTKRMFCIWRVPAPWQPITKKGKGMRMGGGKAAIDHYATPVRPNRIIMELAGHCEYAEVREFLKQIADRLPFNAIAVSHESLQEMREKKSLSVNENQNKWTMKYAIQNNLNGCHKYLKPTDHKWFGEYL